MNSCAINGCTTRVQARGWCGKHYRRWWIHGDPLAMAHREKQLQCDVPGCDNHHQAHGFCPKHLYRFKTYGDPLAGGPFRRRGGQCEAPDCGNAAKARGWCESHYRTWSRYGLTPAEYEAMLAAQDGGCALCGGHWGLSVDHDHESGRVRGILCSPCNRALGKLGDTTEHLRRVLAYMEVHDA